MKPLSSVMDKTKEKMKGIFSGTKIIPRLTMRCCMLGARGVGKTSVIASLYSSHREAVSGTELFLLPDGETQQILQGKRAMLEKMFTGLHDKYDLVTESGLPGDARESIFRFSYGMRSERINIDLEIRDYPGEYLRTEPERVAEFVQEADAVLIAIDTPCLMEADGKYDEAKNRPKLVKDFLKNHLKKDEEKLVMFVPLKCEKYFLEGRIDEVTAKVEAEYGDLIAILKEKCSSSTGKKSICCVVAPIQTLGEIAFDSFGKGEDGTIEEIVSSDGSVLPAHVNYHFIKADATYKPKYCEQPLNYLLAFVSKHYASVKESSSEEGLFGKHAKILRLIPNIDFFLLEMDKMGRRRLKDTQGYKVLCGRGRI